MRDQVSLLAALLACALWCGCAITGTPAREVIEKFEAHIQVQPDGALLVREVITVQSTGENVQHGLWREFPPELTDATGNRRPFEFEVREVQIDGDEAEHFTWSIPGATRVYIGNRDVTLEPDRHVFSINYSTTPLVTDVEDKKALVWHPVGRGWTLQVKEMKAVFRLPATATRGVEATVSAEPEAKGEPAQVETGRRRVEVTRTTALQPGERLEVRISWPRTR